MKIRLQPEIRPFLPIFAAGMTCVVGLWWLTCALGASFASGAEAVFWSFLVLALIWAAQSMTDLSGSTAGYTAAVLLWPCWWPLMHSMALRQVDSATGVAPLRLCQTWYSSVWFKVLVEIGLLVLLAWAVMCRRRQSQVDRASGRPPAGR